MSDHTTDEMQDDIDLDWEEWDGSGSFLTHMFAGSLAGVAEHVTIYPIDTVKTHMQCPDCPGDSGCPKGMKGKPPVPNPTLNNNSIKEVLRTLTQSNHASPPNPLRMWRGVQTMFYGCVPAHALYFTSFELTKKYFGADKPGHHPMAAAGCGIVSTFLHDCVMSPIDTIKQRLQLGYYKGTTHAYKEILRVEGWRGLYRSFPTTVAMNVPYGAVMFASNESLKKFLNPDGRFSLGTSMVAGCGGCDDADGLY